MANPLITLTLTQAEFTALLRGDEHGHAILAVEAVLENLARLGDTSMAVIEKHGTTKDAAHYLALVEAKLMECDKYYCDRGCNPDSKRQWVENAHLEALRPALEAEAEARIQDSYTKPQTWTLGDILSPKTPDDEPSGSDYVDVSYIVPEGLR